MSNVTSSWVLVEIVVWFCWWPPEKPWAYQAGNHNRTHDLKYVHDWRVISYFGLSQQRQKLGELSAGPTYKLLSRFKVIEDVYR